MDQRLKELIVKASLLSTGNTPNETLEALSGIKRVTNSLQIALPPLAIKSDW